MPDVMDVQETVAEDLRLELTRVIKAPKARVFDAWTRPAMIRLWFGPGDMKPTTVETEPEVGGAYTIAMQSCAEPGRQSRASGRYLKVEPYDVLQFTWDARWVPGEESLVTIHFREVDGGTEIRLVHDRFHTKASRDAHNNGWAGILDHLAVKLPQMLAAGWSHAAERG